MIQTKTKLLKVFFSVPLYMIFLMGKGQAQCTISQPSYSAPTEGSLLAQSFIPTCNGELSTIKLETDLIGASGVQFKLYEEDGTGILTEIWSISNIDFPANQEVIINMATGTGTTRILQTTSSYVYSLESAAPFTLKFEPSVPPADPYPDGCIVEIMSNTATCIVGAGAGDLLFEIGITAVMPVELLYFTAKPVQKKVLLDWATATETENLGFEIERSKDGSKWAAIGFVQGNGNSNQNAVYSFTDSANKSGFYYYRLKQLDLNGSFEYSPIKGVEIFGAKKRLQVFPNPVASRLNISLEENFLSYEGPIKLRLYHLVSGVKVRERFVSPISSLDLTGLSDGKYILVLSTDHQRWTKSFVKGK